MKKSIFLKAILMLCLSTSVAFSAKRITSLNDELRTQISAATPKKLAAPVSKTKNILIYSNCAGYVHAMAIQSFEHYIKTLKGNIGDSYNFVVSNDFSNFEKDKLATFDAVVLSNTTGRIFTLGRSEARKASKEELAKINTKHDEYLANLMEFVKNGGGLLGIHGACDSNKDSDDYSTMMGGRFINHPWTCGGQKAVILIEETDNPLLKDIWSGGEFISEDELYQVGYGYSRENQRVLLSIDVDRSPIKGDKAKLFQREDLDFGLLWVKEYGKGRVAYVAFGHDHNAFIIPEILELYTRSMQYAAGDLKLDATPKPKTIK